MFSHHSPSSKWTKAISQRKHAVKSAFLADSLALGAHWNYSPEDIAAKFPGGIKELTSPNVAAMQGIHKGKAAGDLTHYGDQNVWLLEFVACKNNPGDFLPFWTAKALCAPADFYIDGATKQTLAKEKGTHDDLAGFAFMAVLLASANSPREFEDQVVRLTQMMHDFPLVVASARFFAKLVVVRLDSTKPIVQDMKALLKSGTWPADFVELVEKPWKAETASMPSDKEAVAPFGEVKQFGETTVLTALSCGVAMALPTVIHLLTKYSTLDAALAANVMLGGDSAARGIVIATVLGAAPSAVTLPWWDQLRAGKLIDLYLKRL